MSQSKEHQDLIKKTVSAILCRYTNLEILSDIQNKPGDPVPPTIEGFKPDIYATQEKRLKIISEIKTNKDIDNKHTENQVITFINYLEQRQNGLFIFSVTGVKANVAKVFLSFIRQSCGVQNMKTKIEVFDTHDFWRLDQMEYRHWHLI